jgi:phosphoglycolate phosphatase-like HAD superfamily hydrolase
MRKLILFDIDGTLLTARSAPRRAFERALVEVYGTAGPIATHEFSGKTDPQIARELLRRAGLDDRVIDDGMAALWEHYLRGLAAALEAPDHRTRVMPGVRPLLAELAGRPADAVLGLLTGNIPAGAALKLASARIEPLTFRFGAYGSDCEQRDGLPPVAVERALAATGVTFRGKDVIVIGDTPHDVTCGRALGVAAVAVATGSHGAADLQAAGADVVFEDLSDTAAVLDALLA